MLCSISPQRYSQPTRKDQRYRGQFDRSWKAQQEVIKHLPIIYVALSKVTSEELPQIVKVLNVNGLVEPEILAELGRQLRRRVLAEDRRGRISRQQMDECEENDG